MQPVIADPEVKCYGDPEFQGGTALTPHQSDLQFAPGHSSTDERATSSASDASSGASSETKEAAFATAAPKTPPSSGSGGGACFPADATVLTENGMRKRMAVLQIGDVVAVGGGKYSRVFAFSHRDADVVSQHVHLSLSTGATLTLSPGHYLIANGKHVAAENVHAGDSLVHEDGRALTADKASIVQATGLYNPHTLAGTIAVNDVVCSTYTTAVAPSAARALLSPLRAFCLTRAMSTYSTA